MHLRHTFQLLPYNQSTNNLNGTTLSLYVKFQYITNGSYDRDSFRLFLAPGKTIENKEKLTRQSSACDFQSTDQTFGQSSVYRKNFLKKYEKIPS